MSDQDQTILSTKRQMESNPPPNQSNNQTLYIAIAVLAVLLLLALGGVGYLMTGGGATNESSRNETDNQVSVSGNNNEINKDEVAGAVDSEVENRDADEAATTPESDDESAEAIITDISPTAPPTPAEPTIEQITFAADVTEDSQPVDPADSFEVGLTEIHAIIDYKNMPSGAIWERVWYKDGEEQLRTEEQWTGGENGTFDYFLDGDGGPLPAGDWTLELFVEGELLATGNFTIELPPTETPTPTETPSPTPTPAPQTSRGGSSGGGGGGTYQLLFSRWDGQFSYVYIADTNGNNQVFIVSRAAGPSWSPDGKRIFFFGEQGINQQIRENRVVCEFNTISGGLVALDLPTPWGDICRVKDGPWTCERRQVDVGQLPADVCLENGIRVFQNLDWKEGTARFAAVSPDGQAVAYDAKPGVDQRIYFRGILNEQQAHIEIPGEHPDWSPNSNLIVYRSGENNKTGIWIANRDGTNRYPITNNGSDAFPVWSPNGRQIAFTREVGGDVEIFTMDADGSNVQQLTEAAGPDTLPVYTPSGDIIFRSARNGSWGIWKMRHNGGNQDEIIPNAGLGSDWTFGKMDVR